MYIYGDYELQQLEATLQMFNTLTLIPTLAVLRTQLGRADC